MADSEDSIEEGFRRQRQPFGNQRQTQVKSEWYFCFGNCEAVTTFLESKHGIHWDFLNFINAVLRGIGESIFANNPFSGLLILIAIFWHDCIVGAMVIASTITAVVTALLLQQNVADINSGMISYNAVLLASVTSSLWTPLYSEPVGYKLWIFVLVGSSLSVFLFSALTNMLSSFKPSVPILSIPFHILIFVIFAILRPPPTDMNTTTTTMTPHTTNSDFEFDDPSSLYNLTMKAPPSHTKLVDLPRFTKGESDMIYTWLTMKNLFLGCIFSISQVFGIANVISALLIFAGVLMFSPILAFMTIYGSVLGTMLGFFLTPFPHDAVFLGVWGFNGLLSSCAIGLFFIFNWYTFLNGTACVVFTVALQLCLMPHFADHRMPVFALPFILSTVLFLCVSTKERQLSRAVVITYPELQRKKYLLDLDIEDELRKAGDEALLHV